MFIRHENFSEYVKAYPVVTTLLVLNIVIFIIGLIPSVGNIMLAYGIGWNLALASGEWWRLMTPIFLHGDFAHLLMNMFSLFIFGPELERFAGKLNFFNIYFISGIIGNVATYVGGGLQYNFHLGASGAIFGIFGAFVALVYYTRDILPELKQVILPIVVLGVLMTFIGQNINVYAHIGGLVTGFVFGLFYFNPKRLKRKTLRRR